MNREMPEGGIARMIDHALLHPIMTDKEIVAGCELAKQLMLRTVCVKPYSIPLVAGILRGSATDVGTVIGFPHGSVATSSKVAESVWAIEQGARELDMVVNVGKVLGNDWEFVRNDIRSVVDAGHDGGALVKVIFETDYVTQDDDKKRLCEICTEAGADFVKTSTGFGFVKTASGYDYTGATPHDIELMRRYSGAAVGVKASGGVRDFNQAAEFVRLGATRLGTSASRAIVEGSGVDLSSY